MIKVGGQAVLEDKSPLQLLGSQNDMATIRLTVEQTLRSLAKFGDAGVERFKRWSALFE